MIVFETATESVGKLSNKEVMLVVADVSVKLSFREFGVLNREYKKASALYIHVGSITLSPTAGVRSSCVVTT